MDLRSVVVVVARHRCAACALLLAWSPWALAATSVRHDCAALAEVALPQARIVSAQRVAAGAFAPPDAKPGEVPPVFRDAPAFCRVRAELMPSEDSDIELEVWLPEKNWNGRFRGQDNGGFAGYLNYAGLATAVRQGYASASTDTGHSGAGAQWALHHPEKIIDFGYRAIHLMTVDAKAIVSAFYGRPARHAYFAGCSNGGREALMEAQRFPDDYDGIIAGAPAYDWTRLLVNALGILQQTDSAGGYIPPAKLPLITQAVLKDCDALDGVADGVLNDPRRCHFDPSVLRCTQKQDKACLTAAQVAALKTVYDGARDRLGKRLYYGTMPGAEDAAGSWNAWIFGPAPDSNAVAFFVKNYFAYMVYDDPHWDFRGIDLDAALALAGRETGTAMDAVDADLHPFTSRGGKLILYHGWNDPAISPLGTVAYYERVVKALGHRQAQRSIRLYMVPGMLHCDGGPGAHSFGQNATDARSDPKHDVFAALVHWVERDQAPEAIIAAQYAGGAQGGHSGMTRPLCPYPEEARYGGTGDKRLAASFACAATPAVRAAAGH